MTPNSKRQVTSIYLTLQRYRVKAQILQCVKGTTIHVNRCPLLHVIIIRAHNHTEFDRRIGALYLLRRLRVPAPWPVVFVERPELYVAVDSSHNRPLGET